MFKNAGLEAFSYDLMSVVLQTGTGDSASLITAKLGIDIKRGKMMKAEGRVLVARELEI